MYEIKKGEKAPRTGVLISFDDYELLKDYKVILAYQKALNEELNWEGRMDEM